MKLGHRLAVAGSAALLLPLLNVSGPANAIGRGNSLNMYQNDGYQGQLLSRYDYDDDLHNDPCSGCDPGPGGNFGDDMSSFSNTSDYYWMIFTHTNGNTSGANATVWCVRPHSHDADLGNNGYSNLEDEISSVRKAGTSSDGLPPVCTRAGGQMLGAPN